MSTQYDSIGSSYNALKTLPASRMERANVRAAVAPYVVGARVLDLACGTGYYTRALLELGAAEVVGLDISEEMVKAARAETAAAMAAAASPRQDQKWSFVVADAAEPFTLGDDDDDTDTDTNDTKRPFDLVLGIWLLNYAPSAAVMTRMWRNIAAHLRPAGGVFVGLMPPPETSVAAVRAHIETNAGPKNGVSLHIVAEVPDGYKTRMVTRRDGANFEFENYHLTKDVYEASARAAGMCGPFVWRPMQMPLAADEVAQLEAGLDEGFWTRYFRNPHCWMAVVER